jgi:hypothetical protein
MVRQSVKKKPAKPGAKAKSCAGEIATGEFQFCETGGRSLDAIWREYFNRHRELFSGLCEEPCTLDVNVDVVQNGPCVSGSNPPPKPGVWITVYIRASCVLLA